jgi:hypothetical protein
LAGDLLPSPPAPRGGGQIVVSEAQVRNLAQNFRRSWNRLPTREELDGLVESHVREEVMVREAMALGLDRDDAIIRRRLQQKVEFVSEQAAALAEPSDEDLRRYLAEHPQSFRVESRASLRQVFLDPRKHSALAADARRLLAELNGPGGEAAASRRGDSLKLLDARYEDASESELARLFGQEFVDSLFKQPVGEWVGPVASGFGVHLVRVDAAQRGGMPPFDTVRPLVLREWSHARRQELLRAYYAQLKSKYAVQVRMPGAEAP